MAHTKSSQFTAVSAVVSVSRAARRGSCQIRSTTPKPPARGMIRASSRSDHTTRCDTVSSAGTPCVSFQYSGAMPQMKKAVKAAQNPPRS